MPRKYHYDKSRELYNLSELLVIPYLSRQELAYYASYSYGVTDYLPITESSSHVIVLVIKHSFIVGRIKTKEDAAHFFFLKKQAYIDRNRMLINNKQILQQHKYNYENRYIKYHAKEISLL